MHPEGALRVLGSPIKALKYLVRELARCGGEPLRAGEFVTTGTLTEALPALKVERVRSWRLSGRDPLGRPLQEMDQRCRGRSRLARSGRHCR